MRVFSMFSGIGGFELGIKKAIPGEYPLVVTAEKRLTCDEYHFEKPSVIIPLVSSTGHGHASLKRITGFSTYQIDLIALTGSTLAARIAGKILTRSAVSSVTTAGKRMDLNETIPIIFSNTMPPYSIGVG